MNGLESATTTSEIGKLSLNGVSSVGAGGDSSIRCKLIELGAGHAQQRRRLALAHLACAVCRQDQGAELRDCHLDRQLMASRVDHELGMEGQQACLLTDGSDW